MRIRLPAFALLLALLLVFSVGACAEPFSLRGVHFGMSKFEVNVVEPLTIRVAEDDRAIYVRSTIAGIPNSQLMYYYTNGSLSDIEYNFGCNQFEGVTVVSDFKNIESSLTEKYGNGVSYSGPYQHSTNLVLQIYDTLAAVAPKACQKACIKRIASFDDCTVQIIHSFISICVRTNQYSNIHLVEYSIVDNPINTPYNDL